MAGVVPALEPGNAEPKGVTFTPEQQAYLDSLIGKARLEGRDSERSKYKDLNISELKKLAEEAKAMKAEKLSAEEKVALRVKELENDAAQKAAQIKERDVREAKRSTIDKLLAEGKVSLPQGTSVSDVLDLVSVNPDETLDTDRLTRLFPPKPPKQSLGSPSQGGQPAPSPSFDEQYMALLKAGKVQDAVMFKNSYFRKSGVIPP